MKTLKTILLAGLVTAIGCAIVSLWVVRREAAQHAALQQAGSPHPSDVDQARNQSVTFEMPTTLATNAMPAEESPRVEAAMPIAVAPEQAAPAVAPSWKAVTTAVAASPPPRSGKPPRQDLLARDALLFVGVDSEAEQYWTLAINDPSLPPTERQDLIEDLNEEGFPDPKNLTTDDLPLILSRIALIEQHVGDAMDEVNADAFMEAYKDLWNMYARVTQW